MTKLLYNPYVNSSNRNETRERDVKFLATIQDRQLKILVKILFQWAFSVTIIYLVRLSVSHSAKTSIFLLFQKKGFMINFFFFSKLLNVCSYILRMTSNGFACFIETSCIIPLRNHIIIYRILLKGCIFDILLASHD